MFTRISASLLMFATASFAASCAAAELASPTDAPEPDLSAARAVFRADSALYLAFPVEVALLAQAGIPADATGLVGRNRTWGGMYAARFQLGTGAALRGTIVAARWGDATRAFLGVEVGLSTMEASGRLPASVPESVSMGAVPSAADLASGAAFFLGDACVGVLALEYSSNRTSVASDARRLELRARLHRSATWLLSAGSLLAAADAAAPNRLLFDARAFAGCGALLSDAALGAEGLRFVNAAMAAMRPDGAFDEGGGWDTSYQAVALDIGMDVYALLPESPTRDSLAGTLARAAVWLADRVQPDGRVNSTGNRRTCGGGESFLGEAKRLSLSSVVAGLAKAGVAPFDAATSTSAAAAARRVSAWAQANPGLDPCFEFTSRLQQPLR